MDGVSEHFHAPYYGKLTNLRLTNVQFCQNIVQYCQMDAVSEHFHAPYYGKISTLD